MSLENTEQMMSFGDTLRSITADQLRAVVNANVSAHETGASDSVRLATSLINDYPELADFARTAADALFTDGADIDPDLRILLIANTTITLGALCRVVESKELFGY